MSVMNQFKKMFMTQLRMTLREKQAWFWGIFFPVILMVIFMVIFSGGSDDDFKVKVAAVAEQSNESSNMMLQQLKQIPVFEWVEEEPVTRDYAETLVKDKDVSAAIVLPSADGDTSLSLILNKEDEQNSTSMAVISILNEYIQKANLMAAGVEPVFVLNVESVSAGSDDLKYQDFLLTGMIALSIAQGGLFGMVDMVEMRRKGLLKRLRMTPAKMGLFGFSDMLMRLVFAMFQIILLSLIGVYVFGATLHIDLVSLLIIFLFGSLAFNAIGYFFSSFSKTTEAYMGIANIASFLMMFLSGVFFPIETMPGWLQPVSKVLPLTYFVSGLRDGMVYATGWLDGTFWLGIGVLVLWGAITFLLGSLLYRNRSIAAR
jgi:ABC-2 type transport system permease protein